MSYRQGRILGYDLKPRSMVAKKNVGIEFLVEATDEPLRWFGDATGERGYRWTSDLPTPSEGATS